MSENKYAPNLQEMREDLADFVKLSPETPDSHVMLYHRLLTNIHDKELPSWLRRELEVIFEMLSDGNTDWQDCIEQFKSLVNRNAEFEGDEVGRWDK